MIQFDTNIWLVSRKRCRGFFQTESIDDYLNLYIDESYPGYNQCFRDMARYCIWLCFDSAPMSAQLSGKLDAGKYFKSVMCTYSVCHILGHIFNHTLIAGP